MSKRRPWYVVVLAIGLLIVASSVVVVLAKKGLNPETPDLQSQKIGFQTRKRPRITQQPAAFTLARRLGKRFLRKQDLRCVIEGQVRIGSEERSVRLIRELQKEGEEVTISLTGINDPLVWSARTSANKNDSIESTIVERLVQDSPDQFIAAQTQGSAYRMIARNVRPAGVSDNYDGPTWDIVQVQQLSSNADEKGADAALFYINTKTGLLQRIVRKVNGEPIQAEIDQWETQNGETFPKRIVWRRSEQLLMEFTVTKFNF